MKCPICNGKGEINNEFTKYMESCGQWRENEVQTNEEWLKSLDTKQLARIIYELMWHKEKYHELCVYPVVDSVVEWLKQPHTTIKE